MKVVVLGAGGIVGQHLLVSQPPEHDVVYTRRTGGPLWTQLAAEDGPAVTAFLRDAAPDVIINLAGENRVDVVEENPDDSWYVNAELPGDLINWCDANSVHLIHASTQGIFDGEHPRYGPDSPPSPITEYGKQKAVAEERVRAGANWTIARLTFVLGVRPFAGVGRPNPLEQMLAEPEQVQVNDRWFSPLFADDAAAALWRLVADQPKARVVHVGTPVKVSRYDIAAGIVHATHRHPENAPKIHPVSHSYFKGIAPRPCDTSWDWDETIWFSEVEQGLLDADIAFRGRERMDLAHRAREIALFFQAPETDVAARLAQGFGPLHTAVADDFLAASHYGDTELLDWYRNTPAYIWELSAYHLDDGFNYMGMCDGFATHLANVRAKHVLCLGDGIGDLTLTLAKRGLEPVYHDLAGSRTAEFARLRHELNLQRPPLHLLTEGWEANLGFESYDAIVALDFFEHLTVVEQWARACADALRPGGWFFAQNAFAIGDWEHGNSIPMHLSRNNRFERDWDPLLRSLGLRPTDGGWWRK